MVDPAQLGRRPPRTALLGPWCAWIAGLKPEPSAPPDVALRALATPVLLDEWQAVLGVLGAVKRAVDDETGAGRFLLTGGVQADLDAQTWPGTGRLVRVQMCGLTARSTQNAGHHLITLSGIVAYHSTTPAAKNGLATERLLRASRELGALGAPTHAILTACAMPSKRARDSRGSNHPRSKGRLPFVTKEANITPR